MSTSPAAVVGAGIVGLATAFALAERGLPVTVYERGAPGTAQSGGETRLFRTAHDDPRLAAAALAGRHIWSRWSQRLGVELVSDDGALTIGPAAERRLDLLRRLPGMAARRVEPAELVQRLPVLAPFDGPAMLDELGGAIRARAAIEALTTALGDAVVTDEVLSIERTGHGVEVRGGGTCVEHSQVVVCAGPDTVRLARQLGVDIPVRLTAHGRATFRVAGTPPARMACLQDSSDSFGEPGAYGAPLLGNDRYALGVGGHVPVHDDGSIADPHGLAELTRRAGTYVEQALPGLDADAVDVRHCWVPELPWGADALGVWEVERVLLVAGTNLFKHAPWLGEQLAAAVAGDPLLPQLRPEARLGAPAS